MLDLDENEEIKDLLKRKVKLSKDGHKTSELADVIYRLGYLHYYKGYYKEALEEFENALALRKKLSVNADLANTHRYIGETLCKIGEDFDRAKTELSMYYSIALKLKDLVLVQQAHTTLGNYYLVLCDFKDCKSNRNTNLNEAYSHYLKSYDVLNDISEKRLVDAKEFSIMKARSCLNCAFVLDEKRDIIICNEYLKTAIEICEKNHLYEDLIRCYYIKCDQAKRKNKMEETLKMADRIVEITKKSKDHIQQSQDFSFVADTYLKIQNFEKAKILLRQAYKLRKQCLIGPEIKTKLKHVMNIVRLQKKISILNTNFKDLGEELKMDLEKSLEVGKVYEKLADSFCYIGLYDQGLNTYLKQLEIAKIINGSNSELSIIYGSIAQTYLDLNDLVNALVYYELELEANHISPETQVISLLNVCSIKEKLKVEFTELKEIYLKAYKTAKDASKIHLQLKVMNALKESQTEYGIDCSDTQRTISSLNEIKKIKDTIKSKGEESDDQEATTDDEEEDNESLVFSSESEDDEKMDLEAMNDEKSCPAVYKTRNNAPKKYVVKRNLRGETNLHVACIKGNFKMVQKLLEEGHPVNERDNLNWLPIHEACNYGHVQIVESLIKYGAKLNDMLGPMPPLHDASQNGHFEVIKLLLKAGALVYSFDHDGYTPLDHLCYYKKTYMDNKPETTTEEDLELFKECYDQMLRSIRSKDKLYKIKQVTSSEGNFVVNEKSNDQYEEDECVKSRAISSRHQRKGGVNVGIDDFDSDENVNDSPCNLKSKSKKKKAVSDYKSAISNIGSKVTASSLGGFVGKRNIDKVIITESEKEASDDWLINDMVKSSHINSTGSNKRKSHHVSETESEDEDGIMCDKYIDKELANLSFNELEKLDEVTGIKSPISKKRLIDPSGYSQNGDAGIYQIDDSSIAEKVTNYGYDTDSYCKMSSELRRINEVPVKITSVWKRQKTSEKDIEIASPFKANKNYQIISNHSDASYTTKHKTQLKLNKMNNFIKKDSSKENMFSELGNEEIKLVDSRPADRRETTKEHLNVVSEPLNEPVNTSWKIKAIIDNRNFLIPIVNINATIDDLTTQITTRYKAIFKNDPAFREPDNVILKSSDDLILFGEDLIKDVLTDLCQVQLIIESCKNAPTLNEIYKKNCLTINLSCLHGIEGFLKESESNYELNLSSLFIENSTMSNQLEAIFESLNQVAKQPSTINNQYFQNLTKIDLSFNQITDQIAVCFVEKVFIECANLKILNLENNLITTKGLKAFSDLGSSNKTSSRIDCFQLESLLLSGNDFGGLLSPSGLLNIFSGILVFFQSLKTFHVSDCKITLDELDILNFDENSWKRLLNTIKISNLTNVDISYNHFSLKYFSDLVESLPDHQIEFLNLTNSLINRKADNKSTQSKLDLIDSITKLSGSNLVSLALRGIGFTVEETTVLIDHLCACKNLKRIDLSNNSIKKSSVQNLFDMCNRLESAMLVTEKFADEQDFGTTWFDIVKAKFNETNSVPLRHIELKVEDKNERNKIKACFRSEWQKSFIKNVYFSKNVFEIRVDYV